MPKNTKIEIWQKANTVCAGRETGDADVLFRVYEGSDAEENAKSFLSKPLNSMLYAKKEEIEIENEDEGNEDEGNEDEGNENKPLGGEVESYGELSVKELKAEIKARGLEIPEKAKKPKLIKVLENSDVE